MTRATTSPRTVPYRWLVFSLLGLAYFFANFHRVSPAVVAVDLMRDLSADATLLGFLASAYFYAYALMQLPAGLLSDSWGPRRLVTVFTLLAGAASICFGLSATAGQAIASRVFVGMGVAMLFVPTAKILTCWFKRSEFVFMTSVIMVISGLGLLSASAPLAYLNKLLGWRSSFVVIGAVTLVLAVVIWLSVRNRPEELGFPAPEDPEPSTAPGQASLNIPLFTGMKMVLSRHSFWPLALWFFCTSSIFFSFIGLWGGPYMRDVYKMDPSRAGEALSMASLAIIFGSLVISFISERVVKSRKKILIFASSCNLIMTALLAFFTADMPPVVLWFLCAGFGVFSSTVAPIATTQAKELFPLSIAGTAVGTINLFPFLGAAVIQPLVGYVLDLYGSAGGSYSAEAYSRGFTVLFIISVTAFIAVFFTEETIKRRQEVK
ncbi:MAG: MFS transporter [Pseudomonadota bacterium]